MYGPLGITCIQVLVLVTHPPVSEQTLTTLTRKAVHVVEDVTVITSSRIRPELVGSDAEVSHSKISDDSQRAVTRFKMKACYRLLLPRCESFVYFLYLAANSNPFLPKKYVVNPSAGNSNEA